MLRNAQLGNFDMDSIFSTISKTEIDPDVILYIIKATIFYKDP